MFDWIQTYTGKKFFPLAPQSEDIDLEDIAHSLSMMCRYGGHTHQFYSVAEHCVLMSYQIHPEYWSYALLHDASEAYLVDVPRPVKRGLVGYRGFENLLLSMIYRKWGLTPWSDDEPLPPLVREYDLRMLLTERQVLLPNTRFSWAPEIENLLPVEVGINSWPPFVAKKRFLERARELGVRDA